MVQNESMRVEYWWKICQSLCVCESSFWPGENVSKEGKKDESGHKRDQASSSAHTWWTPPPGLIFPCHEGCGGSSCCFYFGLRLGCSTDPGRSAVNATAKPSHYRQRDLGLLCGGCRLCSFSLPFASIAKLLLPVRLTFALVPLTRPATYGVFTYGVWMDELVAVYVCVCRLSTFFVWF